MTTDEILTTLMKLGRPQIAAIYKRHGSGDRVFGVLTSEIVRIRRKIKVDHALAMQLWRTRIAEARILALQVADPAKLRRAEADRFVREGPVHFVACYLSDLLARSPIADRTMQDWMASKEESMREIGYGIFSARLRDDPESISDAKAAKVLAAIERQIHRSPNWARYAMNGALIAIGIYKPALRNQAIEAAQRIGKVEVDWGDTGCKTPDAVPYIQKAARRKMCP
jgi:3-methyladenine DNA glycosylase AlkD